MSLKTSCTAILALSLLLSTAPAAWAQTGGGVSVITKTPAKPHTGEQPAAAQQQPAQQPAQQQPAQQQPTTQQPAQGQTTEQPAEQPPFQEQAAPQKPEGAEPAPAETGATGQANAVEGQGKAQGQGWDTQFSTVGPESSAYTGTPQQIAIIQKINAYFNNLRNLEGTFLQTDADDKHKKGKFFIERPGKVRFDYALPSKQKIISDGRYLAIEDHDLNTTDRYPIDQTPFRLLLQPEVDLSRDSRIVAVDVGPTVAVVTLEDQGGNSSGQIRLFFDWPKVQLKEWLISDPQGLNTRIELANVELNKPADPKLFKFSPDVGMPKFRGDGN
jgi:outer membrane lipoprotein-sorting protein